MIEAARYPFAPRVDGLSQGTRGNGSQAYASQMWGVTASEYMRIAEPWPLNPDGELLFGLKIENPRADANVETSVRVPGIAFAEWGPGDHGFYLMGRPGTYKGGGEAAPQMAAVRRRVLDATRAAGIKFLNACTEDNVIDQIKDGTMICTGGDSPAASVCWIIHALARSASVVPEMGRVTITAGVLWPVRVGPASPRPRMNSRNSLKSSGPCSIS